jgi:chromosome segregation ATPase
LAALTLEQATIDSEKDALKSRISQLEDELRRAGDELCDLRAINDEMRGKMTILEELYMQQTSEMDALEI